MSILPLILTFMCMLIAAVWAGRHITISRSYRVDRPLTGSDPGPPADPPRLSVLVAAKDEKHNIGPCVRSMLAQDYPNFEVIAIDDRSTDGTSEILAAMAAEDPRLRVLTIDELPRPWYGKNHAMWTGVQEATGDWLCMIDADTRHTSRRSLSVSVQYAIDHGADLLSLLPKLEMIGFWENVVQPVCGAVMVYWFQPEKVNSTRFDHAYANGAFMLFRKSAYEAIGGHEGIAEQMMEDLRLAERIKGGGHRLMVCPNDGLFVSRMYTSLAQIVNGWSRIFWGTFTSKRKLRVSMMFLGVMGLMPHLVAVGGWWMWSTTADPSWRMASFAGAIAAVSQMWLVARLYKLMRGRPGYFWTWPIGCIVGLHCLVRAYGLHRRGAKLTWRDTSYMAAGD